MCVCASISDALPHEGQIDSKMIQLKELIGIFGGRNEELERVVGLLVTLGCIGRLTDGRPADAGAASNALPFAA